MKGQVIGVTLKALPLYVNLYGLPTPECEVLACDYSPLKGQSIFTVVCGGKKIDMYERCFEDYEGGEQK